MIRQRRLSRRIPLPVLSRVALAVVLGGIVPAGLRAEDMATVPAGAGARADASMMAGMRSMQQAMGRAPVSGDPDRDFVSMMTPHHRGAIEMAEAELRYGRDPQLRRLARSVIAAQQRDLAEMDRWAASHPAPVR